MENRQDSSSRRSRPNNVKCVFCSSDRSDVANLGGWRELDDIRVHYNCLVITSMMGSFSQRLKFSCQIIVLPFAQLLAGHCPQMGDYSEGILGFLSHDILRAIEYAKKKVCTYCQKTGASISCHHPKCHQRFHLPCGIRAGCLHQLSGQYSSFCSNHLPAVLVNESAPSRPMCVICQTMVVDRSPVERIPSCCGRTWFHRDCMQEYALQLGYHVRCIYCQESTEKYRDILRNHGIYVPATANETRCMAIVCRCPHPAGPYQNDDIFTSRWCFARCRKCRAPCHFGCITNDLEEYCRSCLALHARNT